VRELGLLAVPLAALGYLVVLGAGLTVGLTRRFPLDAQAALTPIVGAAVVAVASPLVPLGAPPRVLAVVLAALGAGVTILRRRPVARVLRAGAVPLTVAVCAVAVVGAPSLARGDWRATSLYESTDSYHWPSQARSYLDGPAAAPSSEHPDRLTYERTKKQHWAFALPFGVLQVAWISGADPADVYAAVAALVFALVPLAGFFCARACFGWRRVWAVAVALLLAADASLLFASHFSWQQQLAGTAFAFAGVVVLRMALERERAGAELVLAALLAAAALASYRLGFAPYLAGLFGVVLLAYGWSLRWNLRPVLRRLAAFAAWFAVLGAPSLVAVGAGFGDFLASGGFSTDFKERFPHGQVAEALGLVPRLWAREAGWPSAASVAWLAAASAVGAALLLAGIRALRRSDVPRADLLVAGLVVSVGGYFVFLLPAFSPYLSYKVLAYGAPFLVLLALTPLAYGRGRLRLVAALAVAALALPSATVATVRAVDDSRTPGPLTALPASRLPSKAVLAIAIADPWEQAWALYYLRAHRLSVERPSFVLTGEGWHHDSATYRHRPVEYVVGRRPVGAVVWRSGDVVISACPKAIPPSRRSRTLTTATSAACASTSSTSTRRGIASRAR
jgi:hypothetical protein